MDTQEMSIQDTTFIQSIETKVKDTIEKYDLIPKEGKIAVAVSGGKDSTVVLYILKKLGYAVEAITVNAHIGCYSAESLNKVKKFCEDQNVKLSVCSFRKNYGYSVCYITDVLSKKEQVLGTCTVCGVLRRRLLNMGAKSINADVLVTGHNMDDEVQTYLMNIFRNRQSLNARLGPKPGLIKIEEFVQRAKPLYLISEDDIEKYSKLMGFPVKYGICPCSVDSFRFNLKEFLKEYKKICPEIFYNVIEHMEKVKPKLQEKFKTEELPGKCDTCGEPTSGKVCRACDILGKFKHATQIDKIIGSDIPRRPQRKIPKVKIPNTCS